MSAFPQQVNYANLPRKAMGSRVSKIQVSARNGSTFNDGGQIQIQLPTMANSYANLGNAYLKFKVKAVGNASHLDHTAYSLFNRMTTTSQSAVIDDITQMNVLYSALLDVGMGSASLRDWGHQCLGSDGNDQQSHLGGALSTSALKGCALPFFTGLWNSDKLLPLDTADGVVFTWYLETALNSLIADAHGSLPTGFVIEDVALHMYVYTLSPESQALLDQSVGDMGYTSIFESVAHSSDSKATTELTKISTLGFRYSSLSKVLITHRVSANQGSATQLSISNRSHAKMKECGLMIGGLPVPERPIVSDPTISDFCEPLSETLLSFGVLGDKFAQLGLNGLTRDRLTNDASTDDAFTNHHNRYAVEDGTLASSKDYQDVKLHNFAGMGSFLVSIDTDIVKNAIGGEASGLYSGIDTLGATTQSRIVYSGNSTSAQTIDYYGFYNSILQLNPITRSWEVSN
jgi:hypothetical protein